MGTVLMSSVATTTTTTASLLGIVMQNEVIPRFCADSSSKPGGGDVKEDSQPRRFSPVPAIDVEDACFFSKNLEIVLGRVVSCPAVLTLAADIRCRDTRIPSPCPR